MSNFKSVRTLMVIASKIVNMYNALILQRKQSILIYRPTLILTLKKCKNRIAYRHIKLKRESAV